MESVEFRAVVNYSDRYCKRHAQTHRDKAVYATRIVPFAVVRYVGGKDHGVSGIFATEAKAQARAAELNAERAAYNARMAEG